MPAVLFQNLLYIHRVEKISQDVRQESDSDEQQGRDKEREGKEQGNGLDSVEQEKIVLPAFPGSIFEFPYVEEYRWPDHIAEILPYYFREMVYVNEHACGDNHQRCCAVSKVEEIEHCRNSTIDQKMMERVRHGCKTNPEVYKSLRTNRHLKKPETPHFSAWDFRRNVAKTRGFRHAKNLRFLSIPFASLVNGA